MPDKTYKLTVVDNNNFKFFGLLIIVLVMFVGSLFYTFFDPILGLFCTLITGYLVYFSLAGYLFSRKNHALVNAEGITIVINKTPHHLSWSDVNQLGYQAVQLKRSGVLEIHPYLALGTQSVPGGYAKLNPKKSFYFFLNQAFLSQHFGEPKLDLYLNLKQMHDESFQGLISRQASFVKLPPLLLSKSQAEYDQQVTANFET